MYNSCVLNKGNYLYFRIHSISFQQYSRLVTAPAKFPNISHDTHRTFVKTFRDERWNAFSSHWVYRTDEFRNFTGAVTRQNYADYYYYTCKMWNRFENVSHKYRKKDHRIIGKTLILFATSISHGK